MGRGDGTSVLVALTVVVLASTWGVSVADKPNIVLFMVDDLGYNDLSIQGSPDISTPAIDSLCRGGVTFTDAYSVAGKCSPARAGLLGGIHPLQIGHTYNPAHDLKDLTAGMPLQVTTLAETLKKAGYATMATGKWHLGMTAKHHPMNRGFDRFFGFLGGRFPYFENTWTGRDGIDQYLYDDWKVADVSYLTDDFAKKSMEFMEQSKDAGKPFFIYHSVNAPHGPFEVPEEHLNPTIKDKTRQAYVAMVEVVDDSLKRMRNKIKNLGLKSNTLIIFTNDNGGIEKAADNSPLRDFKGASYEGGVRVPFCMNYPGTIKGKKTSSQIVTLLDIYPTLQAIAEVKKGQRNPDLQGANLMPFIIRTGNTKPKNQGVVRDYLHSFKQQQSRDETTLEETLDYEQATIRRGPWKLHLFRSDDRTPWSLNLDDVALYNLDDDPGETTDRLSDPGNMALAQTMLDAFRPWFAKVAEPAFAPSWGGSAWAVNPLSVAITKYPASAKVGVEYKFVAKGSSTEGRRVFYFWEVFRKEDEHFNTFNNVKQTAGVTRRQQYARKAFITFKEPGTWIVRINLEDRRRFRQWTDLVVEVAK